MNADYLALCLWCKNEGLYLGEWLRFHFAIGVDHVILIDNNSDRPLENEVPAEFRDRVTVRWDSDTTTGRQCRAYRRCLTEFRPHYNWIGFIDTDEFIVPKSSPDLPRFLSSYESFGGLGMFWYCFGSGGVIRRTAPVLDSFVMRSRDDFASNNHIKTIVNTRFVLSKEPRDPHHFHYQEGYCCVDENGVPISGPIRKPRTSRLIQLNHYIVRSAEEWEEKRLRGGGNTNSQHTSDFFQNHELTCNVVFDDAAVQLRDSLLPRR